MTNKIKEAIDNKKLTLNDVYIEIVKQGFDKDITYSSLTNWYYGRSYPATKRLKIVAKVLGVEPIVLMDVEALK